MALIITAAGDAKLTISGTNTELASVYSRVEFVFNKNGSNSNASMYFYQSKDYYDAGGASILKLKELGSPSTFSFIIDTSTEKQSLQTGSEAAKTQLEAMGYSVVLVDLD